MIRNAKDLNLDQNVGTLPNVSGAIMGRLRPMTFGLVKKAVDQDTFDTVEERVDVRTRAELQPYKPTELEIEAVGSRSWRWQVVRALPDLVLETDDLVRVDGRPYRVMSVFSWQDYGYVEYKLCEDYRK